MDEASSTGLIRRELPAYRPSVHNQFVHRPGRDMLEVWQRLRQIWRPYNSPGHRLDVLDRLPPLGE
jgi:hypothetical protein